MKSPPAFRVGGEAVEPFETSCHPTHPHQPKSSKSVKRILEEAKDIFIYFIRYLD
jgi:hypothetical protein